jgi:mannonate dehydratase
MQVKYSFTSLGFRAAHREDAVLPPTEFVYEREARSAADDRRQVDADTYWERITYFLEKVVPVAAEYKVKMGCHPQDRRAEGTGWRGVDACSGHRQSGSSCRSRNPAMA